eukprot:SAG31_NODE_2132_length_6374_cov_2.836813_5_plen_359_part_00
MKTVLAEDAKRQHEANRKALRQGKHKMAEDKAAKQVEALGHGIQAGRWAAANAQAAETAAIGKTNDMKAALDRIFKATNMPDVDTLVAAFQERQESEMRQLLLTQEMEDQMHKTQEEIMEFKIAIEEVHGRGRAAEDGRKKMERMLQDRLSDVEKKIADCDEELSKSAEVEERIINKVRQLHIKLGGQPPRDEPDENGQVSETVDIRWTVNSLSLLVEPKITQLCKKFATMESAGLGAPAPAPDIDVDTDYDRMVQQAKAAVAAGGPDATLHRLWLADADIDSSEDEEADQSTRWTIHIQPPSIRGVQVDSDDEEDAIGGALAAGSPDKGLFLSREAIKKREKTFASRASKHAQEEGE